MMDKDAGEIQIGIKEDKDFTGWSNQKIILSLTDGLILEYVNKIQRANQITPSRHLEGRSKGYNLTIEMETGVGKTYTYIKTMYEFNRAYGWSKFIVVVPSVAIREGVCKSFEMTQDHFAEEYGKKIRFFIYNSKHLTDIDHFASDSSVNVMIINSQASNAKGKDARRIKGKPGTNAMKANKHLYDHIVYDSANEQNFAKQLDVNNDVAVYVKLPDDFYISTPVGHYNPDWAIAFLKEL